MLLRVLKLNLRISKNYSFAHLLFLFLYLSSSILLSSCTKDTDSIIEDRYTQIKYYKDTFNKIEDFWDREETTESNSYEIVEDPIDNDNNALKFHLHADDWNASGKRNEFKIDYFFTFDEKDLLSQYAFKFLFTEDFFNDKNKKDWIMIHQWHDKPPQGLSWADYGLGTHPPINVYIQVYPEGVHYIVYSYGLWTKDFKDDKNFIYSEPLEPNKWYVFENTINWSIDESGYSIPKINGNYLINEFEDGKLFGANTYNNQGNYFKFGLYGNYESEESISVYFDDFEYILYERKEEDS